MGAGMIRVYYQGAFVAQFRSWSVALAYVGRRGPEFQLVGV